MGIPLGDRKRLLKATAAYQQMSIPRTSMLSATAASPHSEAERPVEPTRSQNRTVRCRRSASMFKPANDAAQFLGIKLYPNVGGERAPRSACR